MAYSDLDGLSSFAGLSMGGYGYHYLTESTTDQLYVKAQNHVSLCGHMTTMPWMCRDISEPYYSQMLGTPQWTMMPTLKDLGGHSNNPINGRMMGLFFMARDDLHDRSYFGPNRVAIPSYNLLSQCNLYFTDFYCLKLNGPHYLQIVATLRGSPEDALCRSLGVRQLAKENNGFLNISHVAKSVTCADQSGHRGRRQLYVEVYYASSLDIKGVQSTGARILHVACLGKAKPGGKPGCSNCSTCA